MRTNYYRAVQRQSEGYAARVFEELWPAPQVRRSVARFLADVIETAGAITSAWAITLDPDSVRVNIGPVQLMSLCRDDVWFCATGEKGGIWPKFIRDASRGDMVYPRSVKIPSRQFHVRPNMLARLPRELRVTALAYVEAAARRRRGKSSWIRAHSPGVVRFVESYLGISLVAPDKGGSQDDVPDTLDEGSGLPSFPEGAVIRVARNAFERSRPARDACVAAYGYRCSVCDVSLDEVYGPIASQFIHVHHLVPLREIGASYKVDPVRDLRPLCPTCHSVVHLGQPPLSIEEAKALLVRKRP